MSPSIDLGQRGNVSAEYVDDYEFTVREESAHTDSGIEIPRMRVIVREDTDEVVGTVKSNYKVLSHADALNPILHELERRGRDIHKRILVTQGGARMYAHLYFKDTEFNVKGDDRVWPGTTIVNSLDGSVKYLAEPNALRLVCTNGMVIRAAIARFVQLHSKSADWSSVVDDLLGIIDNEDTFNPIRKWASISTDEEMVNNLIKSVFEDKAFPAKYEESVLGELANERSQFGDLTLWNVYNAFHSVLEHDMIREQGKVERARHLDENLFKLFEQAVRV